MQSNLPDTRKSGAAAEDNRPDAPEAEVRPDAEPEKLWWSTKSGMLNTLAVVAIVAAGMVAIFAERPKPKLPPVADVPVQAVTAKAIDASPSALPRVVLDGPAEVSFDQPHPDTYSILGIESRLGEPGHFGLLVHVRVRTHSDRTEHFSKENFMLLIDGESHVADAELTGPAAGNGTGETTISFTVPYGAHVLALRIIHHDPRGGVAELPLRLVADDASEAVAVKTQ